MSFVLPGKLNRSFRAWKSFTKKSVQDTTLRNKACSHHNKTLLGKAMLAWKGYIHLCFRIKVSNLCVSSFGGLSRQSSFPGPSPLPVGWQSYMQSASSHVGATVSWWLVHWTVDRVVWVRVLAGVIMLCSWARHFTLTFPLSTQEYKLVPVNCQGNLTKMLEVICDGLASHLGE